MFIARNHEFFRDQAAFGWNFAFPFLIILGFGVIFSGNTYNSYKVGVFPQHLDRVLLSETTLPESFKENSNFRFVPVKTLEEGIEKIKSHKIDLLVEGSSQENRHWLNDSSERGFVASQLLKAALVPEAAAGRALLVAGEQYRCIDWFFPGIMAMNMMFSALWGVGYIVVRYRKNGALKRLKATPITAFEYLCAQMLSRIFLLMFTFCVVWFGSDLIFDFRIKGSIVLFATTFFLGGLSLCSIGLCLAARGTSEEFASGVLNFISWPMMFLSEVWFSLEGAPEWVQQLAWIFPLTHLLKAARKIMNEGVGLADLQLEYGLLCVSTIFFLCLAAYLFSWNE
jgi:ABC-type polysaccharide/polyol phosphate export permease